MSNIEWITVESDDYPEIPLPEWVGSAGDPLYDPTFYEDGLYDLSEEIEEDLDYEIWWDLVCLLGPGYAAADPCYIVQDEDLPEEGDLFGEVTEEEDDLPPDEPVVTVLAAL